MSSVPITDPWPGLPPLQPFGALPRPATRVTKLANGLRVASEETYGQVGCVALLADAGCMYEPAGKRGICHMLDTLAFSGSERFPAETMSSLMQKHGISAQASSTRDVMMAKVDAFRGSMPLAVSMLVDTVLRPTLKPEEMEWARMTMGFQREAFLADPSQVIAETMFEAAYGPGTAVGFSQFATQEQAAALTEQDLREYVARMIRPDRVVLSGAGVDHDELVAMAEKELGHLRPFEGSPGDADAPFAMPDTTYVGGVQSQPLPLAEGMPGPLMTHASVVFPTVGWKDKRVIAMCVLDTLLGGGSSFSAGGPGKGMYTRLYREVLNRNAWVEALNAFSITGDDKGVFGIFGSAMPQDGSRLLNVILEHLLLLITREASPEELDRARNQLRSTVLMNLESRAILCEDIGRQILTLGERMEVEELCERIAAVSAHDLRDVALDILSGRPTIAILNGTVNDDVHQQVDGIFRQRVQAARDAP